VTRRVAAVDCGTNSLRLLVADVDPGRAELTDVTRRMEIVRLGQGVDRTGQLAPEALARTMVALRDYADVIAASGAQAVRMVATSATRDAANAAEFVRSVKEVLGVAPEVLTGSEEAVLSFTGATAELAAGPDRGPFLVADIGGGSTEFVVGPAGNSPTHAISVNIGCVRMTERHLHGDPPEDQEVAAATADILRKPRRERFNWLCFISFLGGDFITTRIPCRVKRKVGSCMGPHVVHSDFTRDSNRCAYASASVSTGVQCKHGARAAYCELRLLA